MSVSVCAMGLCALPAGVARADIIYQDLGGIAITDKYADVPIDMDLDGSPDVFARYYADCPMPDHEYSDVFFGTAVDRAFIALQPNNFFAKGFGAGSTVGGSMNFKATGDLLSASDEVCDGDYTYMFGDWLGVTTKYLAIKVTLPDGDHYGWIKVQNQTGSHLSFRVLESGYETIPGKPILTGDRGACPGILGQPKPVTIVEGHQIATSVVTTGHVTGFQWFKDGQPLVDDGRITGANKRVLTIKDAAIADSSHYNVAVTGACGDVVSDEAAVWVDADCRDMPGSELLLDGVTGYASVEDSADLHMFTRGTIEFWMHPDWNNTAPMVISKGGPDWCSNHSWSVEYDGAALFPAPLCIPEFTLTSPSGCKVAYLAIPVGEPDQWVHIAATIDTNVGVMRAYVNGALKAETTTTTDGKPIKGLAVAYTPAPMTIGRALNDNEALPTPFAGMIDEVRVWTTARTPEQIAASYDQTVSGGTPGLMACYRFDVDENPGWDASGRGHQGTLHGGATAIPSAVCCAADFDGSGFADAEDYTAFVLSFEAGQSRSDFDRSGFVDFDDFAGFVQAFEAGC
ncbi:MAG: hypothetical protein IT435_04270 [Phycisphaerales bacterium]|nr:hypothetical protein [Phycisphaerales bacterium]